MSGSLDTTFSVRLFEQRSLRFRGGDTTVLGSAPDSCPRGCAGTGRVRVLFLRKICREICRQIFRNSIAIVRLSVAGHCAGALRLHVGGVRHRDREGCGLFGADPARRVDCGYLVTSICKGLSQLVIVIKLGGRNVDWLVILLQSPSLI
jgi:hypothetical protein